MPPLDNEQHGLLPPLTGLPLTGLPKQQVFFGGFRNQSDAKLKLTCCTQPTWSLTFQYLFACYSGLRVVLVEM